LSITVHLLRKFNDWFAYKAKLVGKNFPVLQMFRDALLQQKSVSNSHILHNQTAPLQALKRIGVPNWNIPRSGHHWNALGLQYRQVLKSWQDSLGKLSC
jgi:hypothetical protein